MRWDRNLTQSSGPASYDESVPKDVYRCAADRAGEASPVESVNVEEWIIPILILVVGALMLVSGLTGGATHAAEGGLGVVVVLFGLWCTVETIRAVRR